METSERLLARKTTQIGLLGDRGIASKHMAKLATILRLESEFEKHMTLAEVAMVLERGDKVVGGMYYLNEQGLRSRSGHAIHITDIVKSSGTGVPTYVKYWDPDTGRKIGMPACDFLKIYDPRDVLIIK